VGLQKRASKFYDLTLLPFFESWPPKVSSDHVPRFVNVLRECFFIFHLNSILMR